MCNKKYISHVSVLQPKKHIIKIVAFFLVPSMTCSFCGKNVTEFRSKFKKLSNNKTKSEKAASAFSETPTLEISSFSEQERELLGSDKVYTLNNSLFYAF